MIFLNIYGYGWNESFISIVYFENVLVRCLFYFVYVFWGGFVVRWWIVVFVWGALICWNLGVSRVIFIVIFRVGKFIFLMEERGFESYDVGNVSF